MSTILKALRRLEEERSAQSRRPLREEVTRGPAPGRSRRVARPVLAVLIGLAVAAGAGALTYWVLGPAPEATEPGAEPTELAAAGPSKPPEQPATAARPRTASRARSGSSPSARAAASTPSAAAKAGGSKRELPQGALASPVEVVKRAPAGPRIEPTDPAAPQASEQARSALPRPLDPAEIPGRHKRPSASSLVLPTPSRAAPAEAPEPTHPAPDAGSPAPSEAPETASPTRAKAHPAPQASRPPTATREPEKTEPPVVAVAPEPRRAAPEAEAETLSTPARDEERQAAAPKPKPSEAAVKADGASTPAGKPSVVVPPAREPEEAAAGEIARAEIPGLRVERTVWHPIAERRVAVIEFERTAERREVREGDAVGPLVVSKIEPSGVVFVHDGVEMRRRVGQ